MLGSPEELNCQALLLHPHQIHDKHMNGSSYVVLLAELPINLAQYSSVAVCNQWA